MDINIVTNVHGQYIKGKQESRTTIKSIM